MTTISKGIVPVYKPVGISSYDVIRELKKHFPGEKIGHGGTLDPRAEGVLVIAIGKEHTKNLQTVLKGTDKEYEAIIELGKVSETDDSEGPVTQGNSDIKPSEDDVRNKLQLFIGDIQQTPPKYSAVKIKGVTAYKRARRGEEVVLEPKTVTINAIEVLEYSYPFLTIRVECGSGVYIRSLARDIGEKLKTGAYLKALKRTAVGEFVAHNAHKLDELSQDMR